MNMEAIKQISIFMENKSGRMARVAKALADANVNIRALTIAEAGDFGIVRMVVDDTDRGYKVLHDEGFTVSETEVLAVAIQDSPGGLYEIANTLGENNINMDYAYAFVTAKAERAMLILRVDDISGATRVLSEAGIRTATKAEIEIVSHAKPVSHSKILPFISMSFDDTDKDVNEYVIGILKALQIDFVTAERYSRGSIPQKIQNRIHDSGLFIGIFVKQDKIEGGGYTTPSWLLKELGIAQGTGKDVIAWVERGIKDIAGLDYEKEVIYFERRDMKEMQKATSIFLEALREHGLT